VRREADRGLAVCGFVDIARIGRAERVPDAGPRVDEAEVDRIFREESGRSLATLTKIFGDIDVAEDAVQEAFAVALRKWASDGLPPNPGGWITTTARNSAIDHLRREARGRQILARSQPSSPRTTLPACPRR
jgi:predicted RNA polymerase sigma factor